MLQDGNLETPLALGAVMFPSLFFQVLQLGSGCSHGPVPAGFPEEHS